MQVVWGQFKLSPLFSPRLCLLGTHGVPGVWSCLFLFLRHFSSFGSFSAFSAALSVEFYIVGLLAEPSIQFLARLPSVFFLCCVFSLSISAYFCSGSLSHFVSSLVSIARDPPDAIGRLIHLLCLCDAIVASFSFTALCLLLWSFPCLQLKVDTSCCDAILYNPL